MLEPVNCDFLGGEFRTQPPLRGLRLNQCSVDMYVEKQEQLVIFMNKIERRNFWFLLQMVCSFCTLIFLAILAGCSNKSSSRQEGCRNMPETPIEQVLKKHTKALMSISGVVGTGRGLHRSEPCIKVFVVRLTPELEEKIPHQLEGYPVIIKETGIFKSLSGDR